MKMVTMEMKPEEKGKSDSCCCSAPCCCDEGKPRYPWGLQLTLENEQLATLGIPALPKVGATMMITATVKVTSCNENECEGEEPRRSVSLQITDMGMDTDQKSSPEKAMKGMFPESSKGA